jgi:SHAQKYF class myb-like DNA-binding protein
MMNTTGKNENPRVLMTSNSSEGLKGAFQLAAATFLNNKTMDEILDASSKHLKEQPESTPGSGPPLVTSNGSKADQQKFDTLSKPASESLVVDLEEPHTRPQDEVDEFSVSEDCPSISLESTTTEVNGDCSVQAADIVFLPAFAQQLKGTPMTRNTFTGVDEDFRSSAANSPSNANLQRRDRPSGKGACLPSIIANWDASIESADQDSNKKSLPPKSIRSPPTSSSAIAIPSKEDSDTPSRITTISTSTNLHLQSVKEDEKRKARLPTLPTTTDGNERDSALLKYLSTVRENLQTKEESCPYKDQPKVNASSTCKATSSLTPPSRNLQSPSTEHLEPAGAGKSAAVAGFLPPLDDASGDSSNVVGGTNEKTRDGELKRNPGTSCKNDKSGLSMPSVMPRDNMEIEPPSADENKKRKSPSDDEEITDDSIPSSDVAGNNLKKKRSDACKKPRFREDVTKQKRISHGSWKTEELGLFLLGIQMYGKDWNQVAALVKTRSYIQVRSHAQYYFAKIDAKNALLKKDDSDAELKFTSEEEKQFMDAIQIHGDDYLMIPKIAPLIPTRTADDVREHLRIYRLAQKRRLQEETKKQQEAENPPAASSGEDEPQDTEYTVVSPPYTAPYKSVIQAPRTDAYATSTDIFALQALAQAQSQSEISRLLKAEDARRRNYSEQAAARNAATLRNNSSGGALPVSYHVTSVPGPATQPPRGSGTAGLGSNNGMTAAARLGTSLAPPLPLVDKLPSSKNLEDEGRFQHHRNLRQNDRLGSNRHDDEPMLYHNDNHNFAFDVDEGVETELEEGGSSSAEELDSDSSNDHDEHSSAEEGDSDSSSDDDQEYSSSLPPFLEQVHAIPCGKAYIQDLLGKRNWKSEIIGGVTILSPLPLYSL